MDKVAMMIKARRLFKDICDLPTIPAIVSKVVALLDDQNSAPDEIADLMLVDQVLAARVIRVVNSPLYRTRNPILSVKRALMLIGFKSMREMILTSYFVEGFKKKEQPFDMKMFWIHSFSVGALSRYIGQLGGFPDLEKAHLVGIVLDIGKVFLGHYCKDEYGEMLETIKNTNCTTHEAEYEYFGTTHCEVGLCLAQRWHFPSEYCDIISHHHFSELATEDPFLTAIVSLADYYCLSRSTLEGIAQVGAPGRSEENAWRVLSEFAPDLTSVSLIRFLDDLDEVYGSVCKEVNLLFNTMTVT
ncbi:MAG: HDOD domain-containing protein [Desulfuromonadaceae bacterium]|nr:HDOD domain-containing protein [Desulfuromonadaceae bacterium]MDD5104767.1 HDOD domain-containing protein [Desulfuromonadaceae bacterium]